jgi:glucose/arabinose dehydrogenase
VALAVGTLLTGALVAGSGSASAAPASRPPKLTFPLRVGALGQAVKVVGVPDSTGRLFIVDRIGRVLVWAPGQARASVYLDLRSEVNSAGGEQGLLSIAVWPGFRGAPLFFVTYTRSDGALVVSRFVPSSETATTVSASAEVQVLVIPHPTYTNHNGGDLAFGKDLDLYISTGDGGGEGDPVDRTMNLASYTGKILRIDPYHVCAPHAHYCVPADNPYVNHAGALPEIWDIGLRNPWRISVDPGLGNLLIGDVGQDRYEEIDAAGPTVKGLNFGWSCREGYVTYNAARCVAGTYYYPPKAVIAHPSAEALIGGVVYRGTKYYALMGPRYIVGDYITGSIWTLNVVSGALSSAGHLTHVTSFGTDANHEVWATTLDGGLYQMVAS